MDIAKELAKLAQLLESNLLTPAEFEQQKQMLLASRSRAPAPDAPTAVGAYTLIEFVGEGGMGLVYRGRHSAPAIASRQGGDVAVKLLHPHLAKKPGFAERMRQEADALAALDHPAIVKVHDIVEDDARVALVMEWVPGRPLSQVIGRETGPIPWDRALPMILPLLDAIEHAHARGVVHRDLKPDNVRVTPAGQLKVLDFGIARVGEGRGHTVAGTGMGTVDYMAPEQYTDASRVDSRADIYALGMTLYEMVAGRLPWEAPSAESSASRPPEFLVMQEKSQGTLPPPTQFYPAIPPWVVDAIMWALQPDPAKRPASVAALRQALVAPPRAAAPSPAPAPTRRAGSGAVLWAVLGVVGAVAVFAWKESERAELERRVLTLNEQLSSSASELRTTSSALTAAKGELTTCNGALDSAKDALVEHWDSHPTRSMRWGFSTSQGESVRIRLFSQDRNWYWPDEDKHYTVGYYSDARPTITCKSGETICFGGWIEGKSTYWGVGEAGDETCNGCCKTCADTYVGFNLTD